MPTEIYKDFQIEAAHRLPNLPHQHKCSRLHGHSFKVRVWIKGPLDPRLGWIMDYADIKSAFQPIFDLLDHSYLNEVEGLENPTSEVLAKWVWDRLNDRMRGLHRVEVRETCTAGAIFQA